MTFGNSNRSVLVGKYLASALLGLLLLTLGFTPQNQEGATATPSTQHVVEPVEQFVTSPYGSTTKKSFFTADEAAQITERNVKAQTEALTLFATLREKANEAEKVQMDQIARRMDAARKDGLAMMDSINSQTNNLLESAKALQNNLERAIKSLTDSSDQNLKSLLEQAKEQHEKLSNLLEKQREQIEKQIEKQKELEAQAAAAAAKASAAGG